MIMRLPRAFSLRSGHILLFMTKTVPECHRVSLCNATMQYHHIQAVAGIADKGQTLSPIRGMAGWFVLVTSTLLRYEGSGATYGARIQFSTQSWPVLWFQIQRCQEQCIFVARSDSVTPSNFQVLSKPAFLFVLFWLENEKPSLSAINLSK